MEGFRQLGKAARELADRHCDWRIVLAQEGGYARSYSAFCLHGTLAGVLGVEPGMDDPCAYLPDNPAHADPELAAVRSVLSAYWPL
jgi:acetoin utilization deacetylase AcuC-like enzyme